MCLRAPLLAIRLYDAGVEGLDSLETADMQRAVKVLDAIRGNVVRFRLCCGAKSCAPLLKLVWFCAVDVVHGSSRQGARRRQDIS